MKIDPKERSRAQAGRAGYEAAALSPLSTWSGSSAGQLRAARVALDLLSIVVAHYMAFELRFGIGLPGFNLTPRDRGPYVIASVMSSLVLFGLVIVNRLHDEDTLFRGSGEFSRIVKAALQTIIVFPALAYLSKTPDISRSWMLIALTLAISFLSGERFLMRRWLAKQRGQGRLRRPAIVVETRGAGAEPGELGDEFHVIGRYDVAEAIELFSAMSKDATPSKPKQRSLSVVIFANGLDDDAVWRVLLHAGHAGCQVFVESPVRSIAPDRMTVRPFGSRTVMRVAPPALTGFQAARKRAFDIVVSAAALIVVAPVLATAALGVLITSGRPIFYGQQRVGRNGRAFTIWKLRTMKADSEAASGPVWAQKDDPRRTPIGKFLRSTSLDELPQIWNVVRGEMSLVGPRPERPSFVDEFTETIPWYQYRHRMRPGITGWAQAHGLRGNSSLEDRVSYDNYYIEHWTLALDVKICLLTVREVLRGEHAY